MSARIDRKTAQNLGLTPKKVKATIALRGDPQRSITIRLPWPPAANNLHAVVRGRKILSARGRQYREEVALSCAAQGIGHIAGPVRMYIAAYPPDNRRRDLSNLLKATEDSLVRAGVMEDDSLIVELRISRGDVVAGGLLSVELAAREAVGV